MTDIYTYTKKRNEINLPPNFIDSKNILKIGVLPNEEDDKLHDFLNNPIHTRRDPNTITLSNFPKLS